MISETVRKKNPGSNANQIILELIKKTYALVSDEVESKGVSKLLDELMKYAHFHFGSEELLMKAYSYPQYMEQKNEHAKIIKELTEKVEELKAHKEYISKLLFFLMQWFVDHDNFFDKKFGEYVNNYRTMV